MKKVILSALMLTAFASTYAQEVKNDTPNASATAQTEKTTPAAKPAAAATTTATAAVANPIATAVKADEKVKIEAAALPEAVKTTLATDTYKDWQIAEVWDIKTNPEYYVVSLKKDDKTNTVNIDKDGKVK